MKTVFITSFHVLISRNILQTAVLRKLLEAEAHLVLIVPSGKVSFFQKEFADERISIVGVTVPKKKGEALLTFLSIALVGVENHLIRDLKTEGSYLRYYVAHFVHAVCGRLFFFHRVIRLLARWYLHTDAFDALFTRYTPDLVFATDIFYREDSALITMANARKIPAIGMVRSWDNATTKGVLLCAPEQILVTNQIIKDELVAIHHVQREHIVVTGIPHYDYVLQPPSLSREDFCAKLGLDPKKKIVLFAPGGRILYQHDADFLSVFARLLDTGSFLEPLQFIVRPPPTDTVDTSTVSGDSRFVLDIPGVSITGRKKENEMSKNDQRHLHDSLYHCDVVITPASTMIIDGMVYNHPVVVLGFDPLTNPSDPIAKFSSYVHLRKLLGSGLVTVSRSETDFVRDMNEALDTPDAHRDERDEVMRRYTYRLDGESGKRVAEAVLLALH